MPDWKQYVREQLPPLQLSPAREAEIVAELAQHLEAAYEESLAKGHSEEEARAAAANVFKDWRVLESELYRAERIVAPSVQKSVQKKVGEWEQKAFKQQKGTGKMLANLWQNLRYGWRTLRKNPGFAVVAVLTLALGIGANTAIFSIVNGVLLQSLPFPEPDRLMMVFEENPEQNAFNWPTSPPTYQDWQRENQVFSHMSLLSQSSFVFTGDGTPQQVRGLEVSTGFFAMLGARPVLGRTFSAEDGEPGKEKVLVLSHSFWQSRFGGDPGIIDRSLRINDDNYIVIGVMPPDFRFSQPGEIWAPILFSPDLLREGMRGARYLPVMARLKPGISREQAIAGMNSLAARLGEQYPNNKGWTVNLVPVMEQLVGSVRPILFVLLGAVGFVLLIACTNVANLLLARASARQKEIAVRAALGASRVRLFRQVLTESLLLFAMGAVAGALFAGWSLSFLVQLAPADITRIGEVRIDAYVLLFTAGLAMVTGLLFGLFPSVRASQANLVEGIRESGRSGGAGVRRTRLRSVLVVSEVALSLVLLVGAGLLVRSFALVQRVPAGFDASNPVML